MTFGIGSLVHVAQIRDTFVTLGSVRKFVKPNACAKLYPPGTSPQLTLGGFPSTRWRNDTICASLEGEIIAKNMSVRRTQV